MLFLCILHVESNRGRNAGKPPVALDEGVLCNDRSLLYSTVRGSAFLFYLSLLIRSALRRGKESIKLNGKYSIERMFLKIEKLHIIDDQNGELKNIGRTKKQKDMINPLNSVSWW